MRCVPLSGDSVDSNDVADGVVGTRQDKIPLCTERTSWGRGSNQYFAERIAKPRPQGRRTQLGITFALRGISSHQCNENRSIRRARHLGIAGASNRVAGSEHGAFGDFGPHTGRGYRASLRTEKQVGFDFLFGINQSGRVLREGAGDLFATSR